MATRWEYRWEKVIPWEVTPLGNIERDKQLIEQRLTESKNRLNELGAEGWEVIGVLADEGSINVLPDGGWPPVGAVRVFELLMKRPLED